MDRYGPEIEVDLLTIYHGRWDLSDWFSGSSAPAWGKLVRLADQLPPHSRFKAAMMDDDEFAARIGVSDESDEPGKRAKMSLEGYDPLLAKVTDVCDLLIGLRETLIAVNSEKGKAPKGTKYMPRPETAFDRLRRAERQKKLNELRNILVPGEA